MPRPKQEGPTRQIYAAIREDVYLAAKARAAEILDGHWPEVIPPEVDRELRRRFDILLPESEMRPAPGLAAGAGGC